MEEVPIVLSDLHQELPTGAIVNGRTIGTATSRCAPDITSIHFDLTTGHYNIRFDDPANMEFWLEVALPESVLKRARTDAEAEADEAIALIE